MDKVSLHLKYFSKYWNEFEFCFSIKDLVQTLLSSRLLSKNLKIKIYKTIILPVVLMDVKHGLLH